VAAIAPGAGVALITLFDEDGAVLYDETAQLALRLTEAGAASVLVAGTSGEFWALEDQERIALTAAVRQATPGVPLIAHVGGVTADRGQELVRAMLDAGADAIIALPLDVQSDQIPAYYEAISSASSAPVLAYHLPQAGAVVELEQLEGLGVAGIKDSSGDGERLAWQVSTGIETYTGAPTLSGLAADLGAAGTMLGVANAMPEDARLAFAGDREALRRLAANSRAAVERFPQGLREMTAQRWGTPPRIRPHH